MGGSIMKKSIIMGILIFIFGIFNVLAEKNDIDTTLKSVVLKHIEYEDAPINLVILDLRNRLKKLTGAQKNLNIILSLSNGKKAENYRVTITLENIPLDNALRYITLKAGLEYFVRDNAVVIADKDIARDKMEIRTFNVRPSNGIISQLKEKNTKAGTENDDMKNNIDFSEKN